MNEFENKDFDEEEQPVLTDEEIQFIKERRRQKLSESENKNSFNDDFFTDFKTTRSEQTDNSKKPFHVNIPTQELFDSGDDEPFFSNYTYESHNNDIPVSKIPSGERYDHESYMAQRDYEFDDEDSKSSHKKSKKDRTERKEKKKRGCGCSSSIVCFILIIAILLAGSFGYVYSLAKKVQPAELNDNHSSELVRNHGVKNILLIGLDKENGGVARSDTMMLMSIDTKNNTIKLTSFLRDLWVYIPGYYNSKLNASYAFGGPQLTVDTIESNFKTDIDHFILVDFEMFEQIIDSLGGVTVDITEKEAKYLTSDTRVKVSAGENTLSGEWALIYARIRKLDSDFNRTGRQRKVITAIIEKATKSNPLTLAAMVSKIMPLIETDISPLELTVFAFSSLAYIHYDIEQLQVPADNTYSSQMISGQAALVPDIEKNIKNIHEFIYGTGD